MSLYCDEGIAQRQCDSLCDEQEPNVLVESASSRGVWETSVLQSQSTLEKERPRYPPSSPIYSFASRQECGRLPFSP